MICHLSLAIFLFYSFRDSSEYEVEGRSITVEIVSIESLPSKENKQTGKERNDSRSKEVSRDYVSDSIIKEDVLHSQDDIVSKESEAYESDFESEYSMAIVKGRINGVSLPVPLYPPLAKKRNITGTNIVDIVIEPSGKISKVLIVKSSGSKLLDDATKETIEKRWKLPPPQKEIIVRKNFEFEIVN